MSIYSTDKRGSLSLTKIDIQRERKEKEREKEKVAVSGTRCRECERRLQKPVIQ